MFAIWWLSHADEDPYQSLSKRKLGGAWEQKLGLAGNEASIYTCHMHEQSTNHISLIKQA